MKKKLLKFILIIALLLNIVVATPITTSATVYEPVKIDEWNGHTYHLYDDELTYFEAISVCLDLGGEPVAINSESENEFIKKLIANGKSDAYWTAATGNAIQNDWSWGGEDFKYSNWGEGEPDPAFGYYCNMVVVRKPKNNLTLGDWDAVNSKNIRYGFICEYENKKSSYFDEEENRAKWLIHDTQGSITRYMDDILQNSYGIQMAEEGENNGYNDMAHFWQELKNVDAITNDITQYENVTISQIDMYEALLIEMLEKTLDERNSKKISLNIQSEYLELADFLLESHGSVIKLDEYKNLSYYGASFADKQEIRKSVTSFYNSKYSSLINMDNVLKIFDTVIKTYDDISQAIICIESYISLRKLDSSMIEFLELLSWKAYGNEELRIAIERCLEIINLDDQELVDLCINKLSSTSLQAAGNCVIRYSWDALTNSLAKFPPVLCTYLAFKGGMFLSDLGANTSKKLEAYVKMKSIADIEKVVFIAYDEIRLAEEYAMFNRGLDLALSALYMDFDAAIAYVKEVDSSVLNRIINYFRKVSLEDLILSIEADKQVAQKKYGTLYDQWVDSLKEDFPDKYYEYKNLNNSIDILDVELRKYVICCPVDVYIYGNNKNLIGSVVGENIFIDKNEEISINTYDNKKIIYLNNKEYTLELVGTDTGAMNVIISEYTNGVSESKKTYFDNIPLSKGSIYQTSSALNEATNSYAVYNNEIIINPNYITSDSIENVKRSIADIHILQTNESNTNIDDLFYDVSDWAKTEISEAVDKDLVPNVLLCRNLTENISRREFAALAVKLYESVSGKAVEYYDCPFTDIENIDIDIKKAYSLNITTGISETIFEPDALINREQLATMLCRVFKKYAWSGWSIEKDNKYFLNYSGVNKFADDDEISGYAKPSVYFMAKHNIINGVGNNKFAPKSTNTVAAFATREQAIIMALRCYNNLFNDEVINDSQIDTLSVDYEKIYLDYAKEIDNGKKSESGFSLIEKNNYSGVILVDLNDDSIPEMFAFSTSMKDGEIDHATLERAFYIENNTVVEHTPWRTENVNPETGLMSYGFDDCFMNNLPGAEEDTETFEVVLENNIDGNKLFGIYYLDIRTDGKTYYNVYPNFYAIDYVVGEGITHTSSEFVEDIYDSYDITDEPLIYELCNNRSCVNMFEAALNKYMRALSQ